MQGCSVVVHLASPFIAQVPKGNVQEVLLDPAIKGALNVLESANDSVLESSVTRVVLTSSIAAIATDGTDYEEALERTGKIMCHEETWNETASADYSPYALSKPLAKKAVWDFVKANGCSDELAGICNPSFVLGPGAKVHESSESYNYVKKWEAAHTRPFRTLTWRSSMFAT